MALPGDALSALDAVGDRLAGIDPRLAALALAFHVANHGLRSLAWRGVLAAAYPGARVPLLGVAAAYATGVALNAVAPARGGDAAKVVLARRLIPDSSLATITATLSVIVVFDLLAATILVLAIGLAGVAPLARPDAGRLAAHAPVAVALILAGALAGWVLMRAARPRVGRLSGKLRQGGAIFRTPGRYLRAVVLPQSAAWCCRIGVVLCLLAAFGLPASVPLAGLVMVLTGASTLVPLAPGGVGTQQVVLAFALSETASAAAVVSFSLGMQAGVTATNALLGVAAAMAVCRTARPLTAVRNALRLVRGDVAAAREPA